MSHKSYENNLVLVTFNRSHHEIPLLTNESTAHKSVVLVCLCLVSVNRQFYVCITNHIN